MKKVSHILNLPQFQITQHKDQVTYHSYIHSGQPNLLPTDLVQ